MMVLLPVLVLAQFQDLLVRDLAVRPAVDQARTVLEGDGTLRRHHLGYTRWLERNPDMAAHEEPYWDLKRFPALRDRLHAFDDTLAADEDAAALFRRHYAALHERTEARAAVDGLHREQLRHREGLAPFGPAWAWLLAHPDKALIFLHHPARLAPMPESLYTVLPEFRQNRERRADLRRAFTLLRDLPDTGQDVTPWWHAANEPGTPLAEAWHGLWDHFGGEPGHFWVWHRRNVALAGQDRAWDWVRYWHGLVRTTPELSAPYFGYLAAVRRQPETGLAARPGDDVAEWPPPGAPPPLPPTPPTVDREAERRKERDRAHAGMMPERPLKPGPTGVRRPSFPARPRKPERPALPDRPEKPPRPAPELRTRE